MALLKSDPLSLFCVNVGSNQLRRVYLVVDMRRASFPFLVFDFSFMIFRLFFILFPSFCRFLTLVFYLFIRIVELFDYGAVSG